MIALRKVRLRLRSAEDGIALVMVIGVAAVMSLLMVAAMSLSLGTIHNSDDDQDWNAALAAAFAGLEEYQSKLSEEPGYVQYGNPASPFSAASTVHLPTTTNPAFGLGATGTWAIGRGPVPAGQPGPGPDLFHYRYEVDNSAYGISGNIRIRSTGAVGAQTRSIVADVRQTGFIDYVYSPDYEYKDPTVPPIPSPLCNPVHSWEGSGRATSCRINFLTGDAIHGPLHSNDTLYICQGTTFDSTVTTARPGGGYAASTVGTGCTGAAPIFSAGPPVYSPSIAMPATNGELIKETRTDIPDEVPRPGCLYTGPTVITFNVGGTMTVKSPWTKNVNISNASGSSGSNALAAQCGTVTALKSAGGATVTVPQNRVVYVQNIPLTGANGAATTDTQTTSGTLRCKTTTGTTIGASFAYSQNIVGFPVNGASASTTEKPAVPGTTATASYGCRNGDVFVSGTNSGGAITIAAQNYVYITGNLTYGNVNTDMTGLVGQNAVFIYNPVNNNSTPSYLYSAINRTVHAAILSVAHTFTAQNYAVADRGTLTILGSIAQKYRGYVSQGTDGYTKNYQYDPRYRYTAPPKFLSPVTTTYGINVWVEISPVMHSDGTCTYKPATTICA